MNAILKSAAIDRHQGAIADLAEELNRSFADVAPLYQEILDMMRSQADIEDYLPILVAKRVRRLVAQGAPA